MYTHFFGFQSDAGLYARFKKLMTRLSKKNGWFVPAGTLLDFILETRGNHILTSSERARLERRWLFHKLRTGTS
jgi:hypothetical protein